MADVFDPDSVDFTAETSNVQQQRKYADMLRQQAAGMENPQGRMVSGHYIAPSPVEYLTKPLVALMGGYYGGNADAAEQALTQRQQQHAQQWRSALPQAVEGRTAMPPNYVMESPEGQAGWSAIKANPVTAERVLKHALAASGNPLLKHEADAYLKYGMQDVEARQKQAATAEENRLKREDAAAEAERQRIERGEQAAANRQSQEQLVRERIDAHKASAAAVGAARSEGAATRAEQGNWRLEDAMGKQYEALTKDARTEIDATRKLTQLAPAMLGRRPNAIEQQSMIVLLNKFLDPGSVVREGEFDRVAQAQGYVQRAQNLINRIANGELMSDQLIAQVVDMGKFYENAAQKKLRSVGDLYVDKARKRGLDPTSVVTDPYYTPSAGAGAPPPPGAVREKKR